MLRSLTTLCLVLAALTQTQPAGAQASDPPPTSAATDILPPPLTDSERSLHLLAELRRLDPGDVALGLAVAREGSALGIIATTREERLHWCATAVEAARAAVALDSTSAEVHYWLAASLGLQADQESGKAKITLAVESYREARRALDLDPEHGGAHHVVGRLHTGAKRLGWVTRMIARGLGLGAILNEASWETAEYHLRTAVVEDPDKLVHHVELAKLYLERGPENKGVAILDSVASRAPRDALDAYYIQEARQLLGGLRPR